MIATEANGRWVVPPMWKGMTVVIMASGHGMSKAVADAVEPAFAPCIVINNTYKLAPWADMLYAADHEWWLANPEAMSFEGLKVTIRGTPHRSIRWLDYTGNEGFEPDPAFVRTGCNSGYQAVHIAAHAGASRILLCGFNLEGGHWHPAHPAPLKQTPLDEYARWIRKFETLVEPLRARNVQVLNCTPHSALKCFPYVELEEALATIKEQNKCHEPSTY